MFAQLSRWRGKYGGCVFFLCSRCNLVFFENVYILGSIGFSMVVCSSLPHTGWRSNSSRNIASRGRETPLTVGGALDPDWVTESVKCVKPAGVRDQAGCDRAMEGSRASPLRAHWLLRAKYLSNERIYTENI